MIYHTIELIDCWTLNWEIMIQIEHTFNRVSKLIVVWNKNQISETSPMKINLVKQTIAIKTIVNMWYFSGVINNVSKTFKA